MKTRRFHALVLALFAALSMGSTCGTRGVHTAVAEAIAAQGSVVHALHQSHQLVYTQATDALRARVQGADYDREVAPINQVFRARSRALQALSASLYAAAALTDAPDGGLPQYAEAARDVLAAIEMDLAVLREGAVLPAVPIPAQVGTVVATLRGIAGAVAAGAQP